MAAAFPEALRKILRCRYAALQDRLCCAGQCIVGLIRSMFPAAVKFGTAPAHAVGRTVVDAVGLALRWVRLTARIHLAAQRVYDLRRVAQRMCCALPCRRRKGWAWQPRPNQKPPDRIAQRDSQQICRAARAAERRHRTGEENSCSGA